MIIEKYLKVLNALLGPRPATNQEHRSLLAGGARKRMSHMANIDPSIQLWKLAVQPIVALSHLFI
jgi:hypothetical protein